MMRDAILAFAKQFEYEPVIENADALQRKSRYALTGMGGSHLAADLLLALRPECPLVVRRDYGLPEIGHALLKESLCIASSYSGNTEEVLAAYDEARSKGYALAAIAVGGELIARAKADGVAYIQLPNTGIQPRSALGLSFLAHLKLLGEEALLRETQALASTLDPASLESTGASLAEEIKDCVPIVYCSQRNETLAWNWKIKLNETGKIPAFYNVFPELNHNEMTGFDVVDTTRHLSERFFVVILKDPEDHPKVQQRMDVLAQLYTDRGLPVHIVQLDGASRLERLFRSLLVADWTAVHTAALYGLESEQVPMVEEFKKRIA